MGLFRSRRGPRSDRKATKDDLAQLRDWCASRRGVEAYVEPQTSVTQTTMLLVAGDGEWTRRRVPSPQAAADFARKQGIPVYDTNRVGYPQRMRDYTMRQRGDRAKTTTTPREAEATRPAGLDTNQRAALGWLEDLAGESAKGHDPEELRRIWRLARSRAHPDRRGGDRAAWDEVEDAARTLGLHT
ncbi:hypothetical protein [Aeromicrobium terrae]|uniref:hypothetical protein n=1 Tax=Aeromicrobium terrae TaxID=2498846 RepID=UPI001C9CE3ED|nr:hypothetical protein [Aeromicrobium terrae]